MRGGTGTGPTRARADAPLTRLARVVLATRILVTGSKFWTDLEVLTAVLSLVWEPQGVLVTGACPEGAEESAARCWASGGVRGALGLRLGPALERVVTGRNQAILAAGVDVCLGFDATAGPKSLTAAAREARVPVFEWQAVLGAGRRS